MAGPGPNPVFATMRHDFIMKTMRAEGRASVAELADSLSVTMETVRRDLVALERMGSVRRVHGGAVLTTVGALPVGEPDSGPPPHVDGIARRALQELPAEGTILLDSGPIALAIARLLPVDAHLTIVTTDLAVAQLLAPHDHQTVLLTGGRITRDGTSLSGAGAEAMLAKVLVDVGFVMTPAVSVSRGLTTESEALATLKATMITASRRSIVVAEGPAVGAEKFQTFADLAEVDLLVTDSSADASEIGSLRERGVHVIAAD